MNVILDSFQEGASRELKAVRDKRGLKVVCEKANQQLDQLFSTALKRSGSEIACCLGCYYCCHLKVDVQPREIFQIADYIRERFSTERQGEILQMAKGNWGKIAPMTADQHFKANLQCPLLEQGKCSVYPVRPASCRMHHSRRVEPCKESFEKPEQLDGPEEVVMSLKATLASAHVGISQAYEASGYDTKPYDLNAALIEALTNPHSERRWRDKKSAFPKNMVAKSSLQNLEQEANDEMW